MVAQPALVRIWLPEIGYYLLLSSSARQYFAGSKTQVRLFALASCAGGGF